MPTTTFDLSPVYGVSTMRMHSSESDPWPGLLFYSASLTWAFDPYSVPIDDISHLDGRANRVGLHRVEDPFCGPFTDAPDPWQFRLPTAARHAQVTTPEFDIEIARELTITEEWWSMAVTHGGRCLLLTAACVLLPRDAPEVAASALNLAAAEGRVHGATIGVKF